MFACWLRLLRAIDASVLWLLRDSQVATDRLVGEAARKGIEAQRLVFAPRVKPDAHLARHRLADLFLDTLPINAHTTASDALWAGLPLLTCADQAFAGRVSASLLRAAGLEELVTASLEEYEARALELASNPSQLAAARGRLAQAHRSSPLFDSERYCRHLESAYLTTWERWQRGAGPEHFAVASRD